MRHEQQLFSTPTCQWLDAHTNDVRDVEFFIVALSRRNQDSGLK
jgi:hypothetical protein